MFQGRLLHMRCLDPLTDGARTGMLGGLVPNIILSGALDARFIGEQACWRHAVRPFLLVVMCY